MKLKTLQLKKNEERRLNAGHLWVYSNEVNTSATPIKNFSPGEQVQIVSHGGKRLGIAYVNPRSLICARLISRSGERLDHHLIQKRLQRALQLRNLLFDKPYYRLVYGESDLLPGLVVDRFGDHLAVQLNSAGMDAVGEVIVEVLQEMLAPRSILLRNDSSTRNLEGLVREVVPAYGAVPDVVEIIENDVKMAAPLKSGQKTGWFYDQRINRAELSRFVQDKRVLDVFSYVGSFAVQAAAKGAKQVWAVDASHSALQLAKENATMNGVEDRFMSVQGDAFDALRALMEEGEKFDVIVVDPPAFIKRKKDHREGLVAYRRVNELAMQLLAEEGIFLTASCSMHLLRDELLDVLRNGARRTGRHAQVIFEGTQGPDHPVHPAIAETRYLKAFIARVVKE